MFKQILHRIFVERKDDKNKPQSYKKKTVEERFEGRSGITKTTEAGNFCSFINAKGPMRQTISLFSSK